MEIQRDKLTDVNVQFKTMVRRKCMKTGSSEAYMEDRRGKISATHWSTQKTQRPLPFGQVSVLPDAALIIFFGT